MSWVLLANDDGIDSPALLPFADALERTLDLPVRVAVPDGERSWSGKAVTRHGPVRARWERRGGRDVAAIDGTPADAVQLGLYHLFLEEFAGAPPQAVVTGINVGFNTGTGFLGSSGTVWAAAEAAYAGLPAVAVSTGPTEDDYPAWRGLATGDGEEATSGWRRIAEVGAATVRRVADSELLAHCDLVSVNMPWSVTEGSPRTVTALSSLSYGSLFAAGEDGHHEVVDRLALTIDDGDHDHPGDVATVRSGAVSVTPVLLPRAAVVPAAARERFERQD